VWVWAGVGADGGRGSGLEMLMSPAPRKRAMRRGGAGSSNSSQALWVACLQHSADGDECSSWRRERNCIDPGLEVGGWSCIRAAARWSDSSLWCSRTSAKAAGTAHGLLFIARACVYMCAYVFCLSYPPGHRLSQPACPSTRPDNL
jgi:hypothetical protein